MQQRDAISFDAWRDRMAPAVRQVEVHRNRVRGGRGYLMIDNRFSGGQLMEFNTMTCAHCGAVVVLRDNNFTRAFPGTTPRARERGYCAKCNAYICDKPGCHAGCFPQEKAVELSLVKPGISLGRGVGGELLDDLKVWDASKLY